MKPFLTKLKASVAIAFCACLFSMSCNATVHKMDTLQYERRVYENEYFRAVVSGYQPRLDTLEIYIGGKVTNNYLIRVETKKEKRFLRKIRKRKNQ